jgi:hypothetical protein
MEQYWAAKEDKTELISEIRNKKDSYHKFLTNSGILEELRKSYSLFYGNSAIIELESGPTIMSVNHYGSLTRSLHTLVTQNRPSFEARAVNSDYKSQSTTILANGLLDYYLREKRLEVNLKEACLMSLYLREGWIVCEWEANGGEEYGINPENGQPVFEGDVKFSTRSILDIVRPTTGPQDWHIVRSLENRFNLIAQYPELEDKISSNNSTLSEMRKWSLSYIADTEKDGDNVEVLTLYHSKTPAMPEGRLVKVCGESILLDGPLPYRKPYIFCIKSMESFQTNFGHSPMMDIMPLQEALDTCMSIALSNINSFGVASLISEKGSLNITNLKTGLLHIEHNKGAQPPSTLNLLQIPNEIFNFSEMLMKSQETISNVNSVSRGNPTGDMSGTAMALVAQQTLVFASGLQASYNSLIENVGSALIEMLQTYAVVPRIAQIAGKSKKSYMQEFKGDDLNGVSRIIVDEANSFTKTTAGKVDLADKLLQSGLIKTGEEYIQVQSTGNLDPLIEHEQSQLMLIRSENEMLRDGKPVMAIMIDDDSLHVLEHSTVLADPEIRQNPQILQVALEHIQQHINQAKTKDPTVSMMLKQNSLSQPMQAPQPQGQNQPQDLQTAQTPEQPNIAGTNQQFNPQGA